MHVPGNPTPFVWLLLATTLIAQTPTQFENRTPPAFTTQALREMAIGDFDGDGDLDVCASTGLFSFTLKGVLLRNDGQGRFTDVTATSLPANTGSTLRTVPFDMDGDGDLDLFVSKQNGPSRLWRNNGSGVFTDVSANLPATAHDHFEVVAADFDGDGDLDLACPVSFPQAGVVPRVFVNNGAGVFTEVLLASPADTRGFVGVDFDLDGDLDLVAGSATGPKFLRNDGSFVFTDVSAQWQPPGTSGSVQCLAVGDLDGDGWPDLVCGRAVTSDLVLRNTGSSFVVIGALPTYASGTKSVVLFDADDDGDLDLARSIVQAGTPLEFARNDGTGVFTPAPSHLPPMLLVTSNFYAADLDGDGDREILIADEVGFFSILNAVLFNRHRDLVVPPAVLGQGWPLTVTSEPGYAQLHHTCRLAVGLTQLPAPLAVPGFGDLWLDLAAPHVVLEGVVFANAGSLTFPLTIPSSASLHGLELHVQALVEQARHQARFTEHRSVIVQ